jgi:hypothetical protein
VLADVGPRALPALTKALESADPALRAGACLALERIGQPAAGAVEPLRLRLTDRDASVRLRAARAVWRVQGKSDEALSALEGLLRGPDAPLRRAALGTLHEMRPRGPAARGLIAPLVGALEADRPTWDASADDVLVGLGPDAVGPVTEALTRLGPVGRFRAVTVLGRLGPAAEGSLPRLSALLGDADLTVAAAAARTLPLLGPKARDFAPALRERLRSAPALRLASADALLRLLPDRASEVVATLIELLGAEAPSDRREAMGLLGRSAKAAAAAVPRLLKSVDEEAPALRVVAAAALTRIDPAHEERVVAAAVAGLRAATAGDRDHRTGPLALRLLGELGPRARAALPALREALRESLRHPGGALEVDTVFDTFQRLGALPDALPPLLEALNAQARGPRREAMHLLQDIGPPALTAVEAALAHGELRPSPEVTTLLNALRRR